MICGNFLSVWCFKDDLNEMENFMMVEKWDKKNEKFKGFVWYMCLKTENCCLKAFVKIRVNEKVR